MLVGMPMQWQITQITAAAPLLLKQDGKKCSRIRKKLDNDSFICIPPTSFTFTAKTETYDGAPGLAVKKLVPVRHLKSGEEEDLFSVSRSEKAHTLRNAFIYF